MKRVVLIHWNAAEAESGVTALKQARFDAVLAVPASGAGLKDFVAQPPDAFLIDLSRMPSQGRAVALAFRQRKATRHVPLVFVGGEPEKVERARQVLPDAHFAEWAGIGDALRAAMRHPPARPLVPGVLADYAGTPLLRKLGIQPGHVVALLGAPRAFERKLEPLPDGARLTTRARAADRVLLFAASLNDLGRRFADAADGVKEGGGLWLIWPKQASRLETDLTQPVVRRFGLDAGWVDYKICAVDDTWSGLLFSRRRK